MSALHRLAAADRNRSRSLLTNGNPHEHTGGVRGVSSRRETCSSTQPARTHNGHGTRGEAKRGQGRERKRCTAARRYWRAKPAEPKTTSETKKKTKHTNACAQGEPGCAQGEQGGSLWNVAHPKWSSRSSVSIAAGVESSISLLRELGACGTERGRPETSGAVRVWELERRGGQKTWDECRRCLRSMSKRCGPRHGPGSGSS